MQNTHDLFVAAAKAGDLRQLKVLDSVHNVGPTALCYAARAAATQNRLKTLSWLVHRSPVLLQDSWAAMRAAAMRAAADAAASAAADAVADAVAEPTTPSCQ